MSAEELKERTRFVGELIRLADRQFAKNYVITIKATEDDPMTVDFFANGMLPSEISVLTEEDLPKEE